MDDRGRSALITGGSSGIGLAVAALLVEQGAHVWVMARSQAGLAAAMEKLQPLKKDAGQKLGCLAVDVADPDQVFPAVEGLVRQVGPLDLVINSAGVSIPGFLRDQAVDSMRQMMAVNYLGTVYVTKAALPGMLQRGAGHIVNISSLAGVVGLFGYGAYGATKFAVRGFSDCLRAELKPLGIRVSIVYPPDVDTPGLAAEAPYKPAELKALVGNATVLPVEVAAQAILDGVRRNRYVIIPGWEGKFIYWLNGVVGKGVYPIMDWLFAQARRKTNSSGGSYG